MRKPALRLALTATLVTAAALGGCRELDRHFAEMGLLHITPVAAPLSAKSRKSVVRRVAKPEPMAAGNRIRQFCGQRHIQFQTGKLNETSHEKSRNDVLCSQA